MVGMGLLIVAFLIGGLYKRWPQWTGEVTKNAEVTVPAATPEAEADPPVAAEQQPPLQEPTTETEPIKAAPQAEELAEPPSPEVIEPTATPTAPPTEPSASTPTNPGPSVISLPPQPNNVSPPPQNAAVQHVPEPTVLLGANLKVQATLKNLRPIDMQQYRMTLYYRAQGTARYRPLAMGRERITWSVNIPVGPDVEAGIEYFIKAKPDDTQNGRLSTLTSATNLTPHQVGVRRF